MNRRQGLRAAPLLLLAGWPVGRALAHGDAAHERPAGPALREQVAWGIAGRAADVGRTIEVRMSDRMRFTPDTIRVHLGETLRIVVHNDGQLLHEFVIGTRQALDEHAALMVRFPNMEHDEPYMAHVQPGGRAELVWQFNRAGTFQFACLIAGHYQAGMVGQLTVEKS